MKNSENGLIEPSNFILDEQKRHEFIKAADKNNPEKIVGRQAEILKRGLKEDPDKTYRDDINSRAPNVEFTK